MMKAVFRTPPPRVYQVAKVYQVGNVTGHISSQGKDRVPTPVSRAVIIRGVRASSASKGNLNSQTILTLFYQVSDVIEVIGYVFIVIPNQAAHYAVRLT